MDVSFCPQDGSWQRDKLGEVSEHGDCLGVVGVHGHRGGGSCNADSTCPL